MAVLAPSVLWSAIVWLHWIRPYIEANGGTSATGLSGRGANDFREAQRIAKEKGEKPWFLGTWMKVLIILEVALLVLLIAALPASKSR